MYEDKIRFKAVDSESQEFAGKFSNFLYNILMIVDFQKVEIE